MLKKPKQKEHSNERSGKTYALIYCRVSSDRQASEGHGLDSQESRCRQYASQRGYETVEVFRDSVTGGGDFMKRPAMRELLSYVEKNAHKNYVVIFDDLKRFARDVAKHWELRHLFTKLNVELESPNFEFKKDNEEAWLNETVNAVFNEYDRRTNRRQVIQKMKARLEAGYWSFGTKNSYKIIKDPVHGKLSIPDENKAHFLTEALEGFANGIFVRKIDACKFLIEKGFWKGQKPEKYVYSFDKMLRDSFYAGYIEYLKWEISRRLGHHKALISLETFELNQKRLGKNQINKQIRKDVSDDLVLRGLLNCGECKEHLTGAKTEGNGGIYWYYFCQNSECKMFRISINRVDVNKRFKKLLNEKTLKPQVEKLAVVIFDRVWKDEVSNFQKKEKEKSISRKNLEEKIEKFSDMVITTTSEKIKNAYEKQIERAMTELEETNEILAETLDFNVPYQTALNKATKMLKSPYKIWDIVDTIEKHRLFFFIFEEKLPYNKIKGYQTNEIPSAIKLFEEFVTPVTTDVDPTGLEPATSSLQMRRSSQMS